MNNYANIVYLLLNLMNKNKKISVKTIINIRHISFCSKYMLYIRMMYIKIQAVSWNVLLLGILYSVGLLHMLTKFYGNGSLFYRDTIRKTNNG